MEVKSKARTDTLQRSLSTTDRIRRLRKGLPAVLSDISAKLNTMQFEVSNVTDHDKLREFVVTIKFLKTVRFWITSCGLNLTFT